MVSVIVCTYNRADLLVDTLSDLRRELEAARPDAELIVVDNNSGDSTRQVVERVAEGSRVPIRYLFEARQGLSVARNAGYRAARGELIVFTDDDIRVTDGWLEDLLRPFDDPTVFGAAGRIRTLWPGPVPVWVGPPDRPHFTGIVGHFDVGDEPKALTRDDPRPLAANMAFRRGVFEEIGLFREDLGRCGGNLAGGEDMDFFTRFLDRYGQIAYVPDAVILHRVPAERLGLRVYHRYVYHSGTNSARYEPPRAVPQLFGVPRYLVRQMAADLAGVPGRLFRRDVSRAFYHFGRLLIAVAYARALRAEARRTPAARDLGRCAGEGT